MCTFQLFKNYVISSNVHDTIVIEMNRKIEIRTDNKKVHIFFVTKKP